MLVTAFQIQVSWGPQALSGGHNSCPGRSCCIKLLHLVRYTLRTTHIWSRTQKQWNQESADVKLVSPRQIRITSTQGSWQFANFAHFLSFGPFTLIPSIRRMNWSFSWNNPLLIIISIKSQRCFAYIESNNMCAYQNQTTRPLCRCPSYTCWLAPGIQLAKDLQRSYTTKHHFLFGQQWLFIQVTQLISFQNKSATLN